MLSIRDLKSLIIALLCMVFVCLYAAPDPAAAQGDDGEWYTIESAYFTVYYRPGVDLKRVEKRLKMRPFYVAGAPKLDPFAGQEEKIAYRLDYIFKRVKEILELRPSIGRVKIKIYEDRHALQSQYYDIFCQRTDVISFYIYKFNTIYTSEADISDSVISHEMGHAVVDNYFVMRPPETIREMLSKYVDMHLDD